ncbi:MAG: anti-sigma B factor antagonist [Cyclobacteriaceae bacterium]|jgi:anti-sigma B factor antagonist
MVDIRTIREGDIEIILVSGEIDASSSIELDNAIKHAATEASRILVDLQGLEYISSAGLGVFISYLEELKSKDIALVLYGMQAKVYEVFQILGLQNLIMITSNKEEAIGLLNEK